MKKIKELEVGEYIQDIDTQGRRDWLYVVSKNHNDLMIKTIKTEHNTMDIFYLNTKEDFKHYE